MNYIEKDSATDLVNNSEHYYVADPQAIDKIADSGNADALAIWVYLTNRSKNWRVKPDHIKAKFSLGRDRYSAAIRVLKDIGVMKKIAIKDKETGAFSGSATFVSNRLGKYLDDNPNIQVSDMSGDGHVQPPPIRSTDTTLPKSGVLPKSGTDTEGARENAPASVTSDQWGGAALNADFDFFADIYREHANGIVKPDDAKLFVKHVVDTELIPDFALGLQNYLNDKATQRSPSYQNFGTLIRERGWMGHKKPKPGSVHVGGAPEPPTAANDEEIRPELAAAMKRLQEI